MKIRLGSGNNLTVAVSLSTKTFTIFGAFNFDVDPNSITIFDNTIGKWVLGGPDNLATATALPVTYSTEDGYPVFGIQLDVLPEGFDSSDALVICLECPDDVAIYNATEFNHVTA